VATRTWTGTFAAQKSMIFSTNEKGTYCSFDNVSMSANQNMFVLGRIGMYNSYNDEGKFHSLDVGAMAREQLVLVSSRPRETS
jgi:hypothetical protein